MPLRLTKRGCTLLAKLTDSFITANSRVKYRAVLLHSARSQPGDTRFSPRLPVSERPYCAKVKVQAIQAWYKQARYQNKLKAESLHGIDDPSEEDLQRELSWLLEDASGQDWRNMGHQQGWSEEAEVWLRISLQELQALWLLRLEDRIPLQYLTGVAHWEDINLAVGPGILIPRPETHCLLDFAAKAAKKRPSLGKGQWADLGCGSGALAVGLAQKIYGIGKVWAVDKSHVACAWTQFNVKRFGLQNEIQVQQGDWFDPLQSLKGQLAGIVSNPPYIEPEVLPTLQAEVRLHEPSEALNGGKSGLKCLEKICSDVATYLQPYGFVGLEMGGPQQAQAVSEMLGDAFCNIQTRKDMFGVERFVTAERHG